MSGKVFGTEAQPIDAELAPYIQNAIMAEIHAEYPDIVTIPLGSVGKKTTPSGDIDLGIKCESRDELEKIVDKVFGYLETKVIESYYIVSIKYPYKVNDEDIKYVSCDFIQVVDENYTKFRYECPDYTKNESAYKTGMKIMFTSMILNHCQERNANMAAGYYGKYDFTPIGLYLYSINIENMMDYTYDFVTTNVDDIIHLPFNEKGSWDDFHSVETLWAAIHSDKFKYVDELKIIELNWFINSYKKGWYSIKPEDFKLSYWTVDEINKKLEFYKGLQKINYMINKGKEI